MKRLFILTAVNAVLFAHFNVMAAQPVDSNLRTGGSVSQKNLGNKSNQVDHFEVVMPLATSVICPTGFGVTDSGCKPIATTCISNLVCEPGSHLTQSCVPDVQKAKITKIEIQKTPVQPVAPEVKKTPAPTPAIVIVSIEKAIEHTNAAHAQELVQLPKSKPQITESQMRIIRDEKLDVGLRVKTYNDAHKLLNDGKSVSSFGSKCEAATNIANKLEKNESDALLDVIQNPRSDPKLKNIANAKFYELKENPNERFRFYGTVEKVCNLELNSILSAP